MNSPFHDIPLEEAEALAARLRREAHRQRPAFSPALHGRICSAIEAQSRATRRGAAFWLAAAAALLATVWAWPLLSDRGADVSPPAIQAARSDNALSSAAETAAADWGQAAQQYLAAADVRPQLARLTSPMDIVLEDARRIGAAVLNRLPVDVNALAADQAG